MSYQVIARKYRPRAFDAVVGQEAVARTLRNAISGGRIAHAYMFSGPRGVGKTSMARILAKALDCLAAPGPTTEPCGACDLCERVARGEDLDVLEIDAASNRKVDDARTLIAGVSFHPTRARFKVYIVDEVHMLTTEAFNALLKTLEEPPPHVKFIFATTDPQKVPPTILSRCQRFDFRPVPAADIARLLAEICRTEGLRAEDEALHAIARASLGGVRDAESLLEQLATLGDGAVRVEDLHALLGTVPAERMRTLFDAVASGEAARVLAETSSVLDAGTDPGELLRQCLRHVHALLVVRAQGPRAADVEADEEGRRRLAAQAQSFADASLVYAVTLFTEALRSSRQLGEGRLFAETALLRLAGHRDLRFLDQVARDLRTLERRIGAPSHDGNGATGGVRGAPDAARPPRADDARAGRAAETPAPQPQAVAEAPPEGPAPGVLSLDVFRERWPRVRESVRTNSLLRAALEAAEPLEADPTRVVLGFGPGAQFQRRTVAEGPGRERLEEALREVFGTRLRVETAESLRTSAAPADGEGSGAGDGTSGRRDRPPDRSADRLTAAETDAVRESPVTKLVEKELGGTIVGMQRED